MYEGENLAGFLKSIQRELESARALDTALPLKIWLKQQFSIGVNDVTRVLERILPVAAVKENTTENCSSKAASVELQAILVASDCSPRWLTKHLSSLASSRNARGNAINRLIENTLPDQQVQGGTIPQPET